MIPVIAIDRFDAFDRDRETEGEKEREKRKERTVTERVNDRPLPRVHCTGLGGQGVGCRVWGVGCRA